VTLHSLLSCHACAGAQAAKLSNVSPAQRVPLPRGEVGRGLVVGTVFAISLL
jgi:hypothetical protein